MSRVLSIDFETRSAADLRRTGAARYFEDPSADVLCAAYAIEDGPVQTWRIGEPCPEEIRAHVLSGGQLAAWNATFEAWGWKYVLGPKHGWPVPALSQWVDTMAQAAAMSIPQSLDGAAQALAMEQQKDKDGMRLIRKFSIPRKARKGETPGLLYWNDPKDHSEDFAAFVRYCAQDVEVERAIRRKLVPLSDYEQRVWELTLRMNDRGVRLDMPLVDALQRIAEQAKGRLDKEMAEATGYEVAACSQVAALTRWLQTQGVDADKLNKNAIEDLLASDLPEQARRAVELRKEAAKTSTAKLATMSEWACRDDRIRGVQLYHGAGTGRWCLPAYTPVTVLRAGEVLEAPIVDVLPTDQVWDGTSWVRHEGVVFSGFREVMHYRGVVATPEHKVYVGPDIHIPLREAAALEKDLWVGQPPVRNLRSDVPEREKIRRLDGHGSPQALVCACETREQHRPPAPPAGFDSQLRRGRFYPVCFDDPRQQTRRAEGGSLLDTHAHPGTELVSGRRSRRRDGLDNLLGRNGCEPHEASGVFEKPFGGLRSKTPSPAGSERRTGPAGVGVAGEEPKNSLLPVVPGDTHRAESARTSEARPSLCQVWSAVDSFAASERGAEVLPGQEVATRAVGDKGPRATEEEYRSRRGGSMGEPGSTREGGAFGKTSRCPEEHRPHGRSEGAPARGHTEILGREARREATFDIVNAGPRNRFRAWGVIVSNSGRGPQFQNMPRGTGTVKDPEDAVDDMLTGDARWIDMIYGRPMSAVSDMLRSCITASPGNRLLAADYSAIEGRVTAWMAGEQDEIDAYRANDAGTGAGIYEIAAGGVFNVDPFKVTKGQRQVGKAATLALGFGGGVLAFNSMAGIYGIDMAPVYPILRETAAAEVLERAGERYEECLERSDTGTDLLTREAWIASEVTKVLWRNKHPHTVELWRGLGDAAREAVSSPGVITTYGKVSYRVARGFLWCRLPSGRCLAYGSPRIEDRKTPWGDTKPSVTALCVDSVTKRWSRFALYGGLLTENAVQAVARDLMAHGMLQAEEAGYPVVMTVHDEGVADVPAGHGSLAEFERLLCSLPDWAAGLPVVASGWEGHRYRKD